MIHLDRGHSSAIAGHSKSNLILVDPPHADQHSLLPWSPSTRTDFFHDSQESFTLTNDSPKSTSPADIPSTAQKQEQLTTSYSPITPAHAEGPKLPEPSPSSPADQRSPVADTSSSLTPPPDAATPSATAAWGANADRRSPAGEAASAEVGAPREEDKADVSEDVDKASRASTPLSELSSAPDDDEEDKTKEEEVSAGGPSGGQKEPHEADGPNKSVQGGATSRGHGSAAPNAQSPREAPPSSHPNPAKSAADARGSSFSQSSTSAVSSPLSQTDFTPFTSLGSDVSLPNHVPNLTTSAGAKLDPKVVTTLELTDQLLSVMMALLTHGVPHEDPVHAQYGAHVQSNLAWLAAAADGKEKGRNNVPLPKMRPPPSVDYVSMDRIHQLYAELPIVFAKEIARREQAAVTLQGTSQVDLQNGLKRNRPDELLPELANKRRDMGDSKLSVPMAPTSHFPNAVPQQMHPGMVPGAGNQLNTLPSLQGTPAPQLSSPAMLPPTVPPGMMGGTVDPQMLAARERARQMQMQQQNMQQQQLAESSRQMSPTHSQQAMAMANMAGPSMGGMRQQGMQQMQNQNQMLMRQFQILQNPMHPLMQYLTQQVPNFTSLSQQQQLQHVQKAQLILQQRQRMASEAGGSMQGMNMMNPGMLSNASMSSGQISPTRSMQQAALSSPPSASGMSFGNQGAGMGMSGAGLHPQQQQFLASLNPQHKQLYLMQQQQHMRNSGMSNPGMMNPQMMAAQERMQQQQRITQASLNANAGMQMSGAMDASGHIPTLRSNPSMSGITRHTRTPSDSAASPSAGMSQRISGHTSDDLQRAMMLQQAQQRGMTPQQMMQQNAGPMQVNFAQNVQQQMSSMGQGAGSYGMSPPNSAGPGAGFGGGMQGGMGGTPQPGTGGQNQWQQQNAIGLGNGQFPFVAPSPAASQHHSDPSMTPRQMSATPAPGQAMAQNSPQVDQGGLADFGDIFNWQ